MDKDTCAAIEKLHKDTHDFDMATVEEDALNKRIDKVSERVDATAVVVEHQIELLMASR